MSKAVKRIASLLLLSLSAAVLWNSPLATAETNPSGIATEFTEIYNVYVEAGETLDVLFTKTGTAAGQDVEITVTGPGNVAHSPDGSGDPSCVVNSTDGTGTACTWTGLSDTASGIWEIDFNTAPPGPPGTSTGTFWTWDISVQDGGEIPGRVYSNQHYMRQSLSGRNDITFWYRSPDGFLYEVSHLGFQGVGSLFRGDATGVREDGSCVSAYRNIQTSGVNGTSLTPGYSLSELGECGDPFKIFVNEPASDLPLSTTLPDGSTTWLAPEPEIPVVSNLEFTGDSTAVRSGDISFDVAGHTGLASAQIDTDDDGVFDGPNDVTIQDFVSGGSGSVYFDGQDGSGNLVPATQDIAARVLITQAGELHFSSVDVETRTVGLQVQVLNGTNPGDYLNVYWNDSLDPNADVNCANSGGGDFSADGRYSEGGVHTWGFSTSDCTGAWGNNKAIDDWTYVPINVVETLQVPGLVAFEADKTSDPEDGAEVNPGDTITYTVTIRNTGQLPLTNFNFDDDLSGVLDDASMVGDPTIEPETAGTATLNGSTLTFEGDIPVDETATFTYTVRVNDDVQPGATLRNVIVGDFSNCTTGEEERCLTTHTVTGSLANTGQNQYFLIALAGMLLAVPSIVIFRHKLVSTVKP